VGPTRVATAIADAAPALRPHGPASIQRID
jgi:hypothetical protein